MIGTPTHIYNMNKEIMTIKIISKEVNCNKCKNKHFPK